MDRIVHKLVTLWMVATTAHLPCPVCDGDDTGSRANPTAAPTRQVSGFDIDFVLLGCDAPDDPDDGPLDDDPDTGTVVGGPFPVFMKSAPTRMRRHGKGLVDASLPFTELTPDCNWRLPPAVTAPAPVHVPSPRRNHPDIPLVMRT